MPTVNFRTDQHLKDKIQKLAKKNNEPSSKYLRRLIEDGIAVAEYKEQNQKINSAPTQTAIRFDSKKKPELLTEYKRNLDFLLIEISAILHLILKESGKFTPEEAAKLLSKAQKQTEAYMKHYEKEEELNQNG